MHGTQRKKRRKEVKIEIKEAMKGWEENEEEEE